MSQSVCAVDHLRAFISNIKLGESDNHRLKSNTLDSLNIS